MIRTLTPESEKPESPEQLKIREIREWLQVCRSMTQAEADQQDKIKRWREAAVGITPSLSGMPGGTGAKDKVGAAVARIAEEEEKLAQRKEVLRLRKDEAYRRILWPLGNDPHYTSRMTEFLEGYYLDCASTDSRKNFQLVTYEQLAARKGVDVSTVKKSMQRAICILAQYWDSL